MAIEIFCHLKKTVIPELLKRIVFFYLQYQLSLTQVRDAANPEPILGTLDTKQEYAYTFTLKDCSTMTLFLIYAYVIFF